MGTVGDRRFDAPRGALVAASRGWERWTERWRTHVVVGLAVAGVPGALGTVLWATTQNPVLLVALASAGIVGGSAASAAFARSDSPSPRQLLVAVALAAAFLLLLAIPAEGWTAAATVAFAAGILVPVRLLGGGSNGYPARLAWARAVVLATAAAATAAASGVALWTTQSAPSEAGHVLVAAVAVTVGAATAPGWLGALDATALDDGATWREGADLPGLATTAVGALPR